MPNLGLTLDGETLPGPPIAIRVLLLFVTVCVVFKLGEHKGVSLGDDPEDGLSLILLAITVPLDEIGDPGEELRGEVGDAKPGTTAARFFPIGVVIVINEGSFLGLKVSPVRLSLASSSSRYS